MADSFTLIIPREQLIAKAKQAHIDPNATSGTLPEIDHVQLSYALLDVGEHSVLPADLVTIEFDVVKKPFYVSVDMIEKHVKGLLSA